LEHRAAALLLGDPARAYGSGIGLLSHRRLIQASNLFATIPPF